MKEKIYVGSRIKCNRRQVDAEEYYIKKLKGVE